MSWLCVDRFADLVYCLQIWYIVCRFGILFADLVYCLQIWYIVCRFGILFADLVYCLQIWYIVCRFGILFADLVYCLQIWYIVCRFGILFADLVYCLQIWYIVCRFGILLTMNYLRTDLSSRWNILFALFLQVDTRTSILSDITKTQVSKVVGHLAFDVKVRTKGKL